MKKHVPLNLQANRIRSGDYATTDDDDLMGAFKVIAPTGELLLILSSGIDKKTGWEHVSVSCQNRTPTWEEMCFAKDLFWDEHEMAVQYHPPKSEYVDFHPFCLHLFRPIVMTVPMPSSLLVGPVQRDDKVAGNRARSPANARPLLSNGDEQDL
jgi:hypothetical protein